jgi:hypothetical protein
MRSTHLAATAYAVFFLGFATAHAQSQQNPAATRAEIAPASTTPNTSGNDLLNGAKPPVQEKLATPETVGQDKASGNDLVSGDNRTDRETGTHPAWTTMDSQKSGYLTAKDVKKHRWLRKNFARCNSSHDGHLTEAEYAACTQ